MLKTFELDNVRPTADRVREAIFNKIQFMVRSARVLDLFGGTGAVSLEFVSRGAQVVTADNNKDSINLIKLNFERAHEKPNLITGDYTSTLEQLKGQTFDIIFLDPPFASNYGDIAIKLIAKYNLLAPNGLIILEHSANKEVNVPESLCLTDSRKYGTIAVSYLGVNSNVEGN